MKRDSLRQSLVYLFVALVVFAFVNVSWADGVEVEVPYAVTNAQWWTGVAIKNLDASSATGTIAVEFFDQEGVFIGTVDIGSIEPQEIYSEVTSTIYSHCLPVYYSLKISHPDRQELVLYSHYLPSNYSLKISHPGNQELAVTVFVGNSATGGFSYQTYKQTPAVLPSWHQKIPGANRFELVLDNEAVLDRETGLVWQRNTSATLYTWDKAILYCYNTDIGGRGGWRLPSIEELRTLTDRTRKDPALPLGHSFTNVKSSRYWSSTTHANNTSLAWHVDFHFGYVNASYYDKTDSHYVRAVRSGQ